MRAVVDANVWIKALAEPGSPQDQLLQALMQHRFTLVCSRPMLSELHMVLLRPEIRRLCHLAVDDVVATISYLRHTSYLVTITGAYSLCRDPDDNKIIETAIRGNAPIIVSQEPDLSDPELAETLSQMDIRVVTAFQFLALLDT